MVYLVQKQILNNCGSNTAPIAEYNQANICQRSTQTIKIKSGSLPTVSKTNNQITVINSRPLFSLRDNGPKSSGR